MYSRLLMLAELGSWRVGMGPWVAVTVKEVSAASGALFAWEEGEVPSLPAFGAMISVANSGGV